MQDSVDFDKTKRAPYVFESVDTLWKVLRDCGNPGASADSTALGGRRMVEFHEWVYPEGKRLKLQG